MKADWEPRLCPGGCGHLHRPCCDSVVGGAHQSSCAETASREGEALGRAAAAERADDPAALE